MRFAGAGKPATGPDCASCLHLWMKRGNTLRFVKVMEEGTGPKKEDVLCNGLINAGVSPPQPAAPQGADTGDCCMALQGPSAAPVGGLCAPPRPPPAVSGHRFCCSYYVALAGRGVCSQGAEETESSGVRGPPVRQHWETWGSGRTCPRHTLLPWGPLTHPNGPVRSAASDLDLDRPQ